MKLFSTPMESNNFTYCRCDYFFVPGGRKERGVEAAKVPGGGELFCAACSIRAIRKQYPTPVCIFVELAIAFLLGIIMDESC